MKFQLVISPITLIVGLLMIAHPVRAVSSSKDQDQAKTRALMTQIFVSLTKVMPLNFDIKAFESKTNRSMILKEIENLKKGSIALSGHFTKFDQSYGYIAKSMSRDIADIHKWYQKGSYSEARYLLQQLTENCTSCHLKLPDPGHAPRMDQFFKNAAIAKLTSPEKARLQVSLRQFDDALATWNTMLKSWPSSGELFAMDVIPDYLKVAVQVKRSIPLANQGLELAKARSPIPTYMNRELNSWSASLKTLAPELTKSGDELSRAEAIIKSARKNMEFPLDRAGYVDFLVASSLLNQFLTQEKITPEQKANTYYLLGVTESLLGRSTWLSQTDFYYETAIRLAPKSKVAAQAFESLEQQLYMEYSGSGGLSMPDDVKGNLDELRSLIR